VSAFRQSYFPRDKDIVREAWVAGDLKEQLGIQHRRDRKKGVPAFNEAPSTLVDHLHKALGADGDYERGYYEPAAMASPQKDIGRSPLLSGSSTPTSRTQFTYPPPSPAIDGVFGYSPSIRQHTTVPPLMLRQSSSNVPQISPTPTGMQRHGSRNSGSPTSPHFQYTSPSALDAFSMASIEVKRLSRASVELKRASVNGRSSDLMNSPSGQGSARTSPVTTSPGVQTSLGAVQDVRLGNPASSDRGLSPIRGSLDASFHKSSEADWAGRDEELIMDFSDASKWDETRRGMDWTNDDADDDHGNERDRHRGSGFAV
jgi:hypothetical protein